MRLFLALALLLAASLPAQAAYHTNGAANPPAGETHAQWGGGGGRK
jgi:Spy/CpxP family protein refolding chaperone